LTRASTNALPNITLARGYVCRREDLAALHVLLRTERESDGHARLNVVVRALVRELMTRETATTRTELRGLAERIGITRRNRVTATARGSLYQTMSLTSAHSGVDQGLST